MDRLLVRLTIALTAIYFMISFVYAQFFGIDILADWHSIPFELCVVVSTFTAGRYHCVYMRSTAISLLLCDIITQVDNYYNFLSVSAHNLIPIGILALGLGTSITLAIRHFYKVAKLRRKLKDRTI